MVSVPEPVSDDQAFKAIKDGVDAARGAKMYLNSGEIPCSLFIYEGYIVLSPSQDHFMAQMLVQTISSFLPGFMRLIPRTQIGLCFASRSVIHRL
jgi:hypothetical protein